MFYAQKAYFFNFVPKLVYIPVSEHFSFANIIHPPDRCSLACILTRHVTHWACLGCSGSTCKTLCSSSCQYPATTHSYWRGVGQHSTGHNQQPDQLYAKEMSCCMWQMVVTPRCRLVFWSTALLFFSSICDQPMHICIPSDVLIHTLGPNV